MPIADLYLFLNDRLHISNPSGLSPAPVLTASSTVAGYAPDNVREADLTKAWKPNDSTTTDEWLKVDGGSTSWTGSGVTYAVLAWDSRGSDQDTVKLQVDSVDDGAFGGTITTKATWAVGSNKSEVTMQWVGFGASAKRWWRLFQAGNERTETTGSVTAKILVWGMFEVTNDLLRLSIDFPGLGEGVYRMSQRYGVNVSRAVAGQPFTNKYSEMTQRFVVVWRPGTDALFTAVRDRLAAMNGMGRAIFVIKEGLHNLAQANIGLCRLTGNWDAVKNFDGQYEIELELETQPWL